MAPEEIQVDENGLIGRDILNYSIIHSREGYVNIGGDKQPSCVKQMKSVTLKWRTLTIVEAWVELDDAFCIVEEEEICPGMYIASLLSQVNSNKAIVSLLESIEITNPSLPRHAMAETVKRSRGRIIRFVKYLK